MRIEPLGTKTFEKRFLQIVIESELEARTLRDLALANCRVPDAVYKDITVFAGYRGNKKTMREIQGKLEIALSQVGL